jgi:WD40 repeat protein
MDQTVKLWNVSEGKVITALQDDGPTGSLAFSPDGKTLVGGGVALGSRKKTIARSWDLDGGKIKRIFKGAFLTSSMAISPDGKTLAIGDFFPGEKDFPLGGKIKLFSADTGEENAILERADPSWPSGCLAFSPDGKTLAAGTGPFLGTGVALWQIAAGKSKSIAKGNRVNSIAFSPDGKTLALATEDVLLYDLDTGKEKAFLRGHKKSWVTAVASAPTAKPWPPPVWTRPSSCGTWRRARRKPLSRVTPMAFSASPSARTARSWPREAWTKASSCGTWLGRSERLRKNEGK